MANTDRKFQDALVYRLFTEFLDKNLLGDRREYDVDEYLASYPDLTRESAIKLCNLVDYKFRGKRMPLSNIDPKIVKEFIVEAFHGNLDGWDDSDKLILVHFLMDLETYAFFANKK